MRKKMLLAGLTLLAGTVLWGCGGVEPEKRDYPQVVAVDEENGRDAAIFGMPNMQETTGQEKPDGGGTDSNRKFTGESLGEIRRIYGETQEKYLDLSHVDVLILGRRLIDSGLWEDVLAEIRDNNSFGEDIYVFAAEDVGKVMKYNGTKTDALGDFLIGIYENRPWHMKKTGVTLRQVYKTWYERDELPVLPTLAVGGDGYLHVAE